nr:adenylylsulfatase hint3 [Quercus suber]
MSDGRNDQATARAQGFGNLRLISVRRVPVGAMPESIGAEYCLFGDRLDDHIAVLLIHELGHLTRKPQKGICIILTPTVALVQQVIWLNLKGASKSRCFKFTLEGSLAFYRQNHDYTMNKYTTQEARSFSSLWIPDFKISWKLDSFNLVVNNGASAGQVIFHTHIHIIPRKAHDCLWPSKSLRGVA